MITKKKFLGLFMVILFLPGFGWSVEYHINVNTGNDNNNGSAASPWKSFIPAKNKLGPGDVVLIHAGEYYVGDYLGGLPRGVAGNYVTFKAFPGDEGKVVLTNTTSLTGWTLDQGAIYKTTVPPETHCLFQDDRPLAGYHGSLWRVTSSNMAPGRWYVQGNFAYAWLYDNANPNSHAMRMGKYYIFQVSEYNIIDGLVFEYGDQGIRVDGSNSIIQNCVFRNLSGQGIYVADNVANIVIRNNRFINVGVTMWDHGVYCSGDDCVIENNDFSQISGGALHVYSSVTSPERNKIRKNTIRDAKPETFPGYNEVGIFDWGKDTEIYYNLIYGRHNVGISFSGSGGKCYHNTIDGAKNALEFTSEASSKDIKNNMLTNVTQFYINKPGTQNCLLNYNLYYSDNAKAQFRWAAVTYNVFADYQNGTHQDLKSVYGRDPQFMNRTLGDFRLTNGSPGIDAGTDVGLPFFGTAPDLGALEFESGVQTGQPVIMDIRFFFANNNVENFSVEPQKWYDLYLYTNDPQGWSDISYADIWLSQESNNEGTISNRGGRHFASTNYVMSYSIADGGIWAKETEGTEIWANIGGRLGVYVDDDNNEYEQNSDQKWAKARVKLLPSAQAGNWKLNAYVVDKEGHISSLFQKNIRVAIAVDQTPPFPPQNVKVSTGSP